MPTMTYWGSKGNHRSYVSKSAHEIMDRIFDVIAELSLGCETIILLLLLFSPKVVSDSCDPMDSSPSVSSVHGISQARILEWVAISFYRGSSRLRDQTHISCLVGKFFTNEPSGKTFLIANPLLVVFSVIWKLKHLNWGRHPKNYVL